MKKNYIILLALILAQTPVGARDLDRTNATKQSKSRESGSKLANTLSLLGQFSKKIPFAGKVLSPVLTNIAQSDELQGKYNVSFAIPNKIAELRKQNISNAEIFNELISDDDSTINFNRDHGKPCAKDDIQEIVTELFPHASKKDQKKFTKTSCFAHLPEDMQSNIEKEIEKNAPKSYTLVEKINPKENNTIVVSDAPLNTLKTAVTTDVSQNSEVNPQVTPEIVVVTPEVKKEEVVVTPEVVNPQDAQAVTTPEIETASKTTETTQTPSTDGTPQPVLPLMPLAQPVTPISGS